MAVDEALFRSAVFRGTATLRIYRFHPETVSFGYRQAISEALDLEGCRAAGVGFVRRPTGGRALLHQHELTYSLAAPTEGVFRGLAVRAVYRAVNGFLRRALEALAVPLDPEPAEGVPDPEPERATPCLAVPRRHEITSGGRKLVASAQRRSSRAFLQHGVFLFRVDEALWARVAPKSERGLSTRLEAVGLEELAGEVTAEKLSEALCAAFAPSFRLSEEPESLLPQELRVVQDLVGKYRSSDWNFERTWGEAGLGPRAPQVDNSEAVW